MQWDDHEVINNWWPGQVYKASDPKPRPDPYIGKAANDLSEDALKVSPILRVTKCPAVCFTRDCMVCVVTYLYSRLSEEYGVANQIKSNQTNGQLFHCVHQIIITLTCASSGQLHHVLH